MAATTMLGQHLDLVSIPVHDPAHTFQALVASATSSRGQLDPGKRRHGNNSPFHDHGIDVLTSDW
jgi:hypothetical protein